MRTTSNALISAPASLTHLPELIAHANIRLPALNLLVLEDTKKSPTEWLSGPKEGRAALAGQAEPR